MSVAIACQRCGRPVQTTGFRGLCLRCLYDCTTVRPASHAQVVSADESEPSEVLDCGLAVGPRGRFILLDRLGEGGMGEVWLANDQELSQAGEPAFVASKFLSHAIKDDPRALAALRLDVRRSQRLSHPNIVRIFERTRGVPLCGFFSTGGACQLV